MAISDFIGSAQRVVEAVALRIEIPLLVILAGIAMGKIVKNVFLRIGAEIELDKHAKKIAGQRIGLNEVIAGSLATIIYTVSVIWALSLAGILRISLFIFLGFLAMFGTLGILLFLRDFLPNLYHGLRSRKFLRKGQKISTQGVSGKVQNIGLLSVRIKTSAGLSIVIPYAGL